MIGRSTWSSVNLPPWFERVTPIANPQFSLFADELPVVLAALRVSDDALGRWHKQGWVSFGPERETPLEAHDVNEIRFVRDVVRSGLSDAYIAELFGQIPRPLNFNPDEVAYSFSLGWVLARPVLERDPNALVDEHVDCWLEGLAANENHARLAELRDRIDCLITTLEAGTQNANGD